MKDILKNDESEHYEQFESMEIDDSKVEKRKKKSKSFLSKKKL